MRKVKLDPKWTLSMDAHEVKKQIAGHIAKLKVIISHLDSKEGEMASINLDGFQALTNTAINLYDQECFKHLKHS